MKYCLWLAGEGTGELLSLLDEEDRVFLRTLHRGKAAEDSYLTQALMKQAARELGFSGVRIRRSEKGAPISEEAGLFLSGTHTGGCCAAAASHHPIGIDAQGIAPAREAVVRRFFLPEERRFLDSQPRRDEAFTLLWTMKEAYGKMTGLGLAAARPVAFYQEDGLLRCADPSVRLFTRRQGVIILSIVESLS